MDLRFPFSLLFTASAQLFLSISMSFLEPLSVLWQDVFLLLKKLQAHYLGHLCLDSKPYFSLVLTNSAFGVFVALTRPLPFDQSFRF